MKDAKGSLPDIFQRRKRYLHSTRDALEWFQPFFIFLTILFFWIDRVDRRHDLTLQQQEMTDTRTNDSWQILATNLEGQSGKKEALEHLHNNGFSLVEVRANNAFLNGLVLAGARLGFANFEGSMLINSNFKRADMQEINLTGANLTSSYLTDTILVNAQMTRANLTGAWLHDASLNSANLEGAIFHETKLPGADLSHANLTGVDLSTSCGTKDTILPEGYTIPLCTSK